MKAYEALKDLPANKHEADEFTRQIVADLEAGEIDPLKFKIFMNALERFLDGIKPTLDRMARDQAEKYGERSFDLMGAKVELKEAGTRYDFSQCGWPVWQRKKDAAKAAEADVKACEEFLKGVKSSVSLTDEDTGEVVTVYPPVKKSTSIVQITLQ